LLVTCFHRIVFKFIDLKWPVNLNFYHTVWRCDDKVYTYENLVNLVDRTDRTEIISLLLRLGSYYDFKILGLIFLNTRNSLLGGIWESGWDPRTRVKVQRTRSSRVMTQEETENLLKDCFNLKSCIPFYTCPHAPFYKETKRLLHSVNTLELKEYS
jgi:hypothetical protein